MLLLPSMTWTAQVFHCVHLVWIEVQIETWHSVPSLIPECSADAAGTRQVAMTQLRQHLSHDVIWKTLQAASAGQLVKVMRARRRAQQSGYGPSLSRICKSMLATIRVCLAQPI